MPIHKHWRWRCRLVQVKHYITTMVDLHLFRVIFWNCFLNTQAFFHLQLPRGMDRHVPSVCLDLVLPEVIKYGLTRRFKFTLKHPPKPHLPRGIAFSWIGDGLSKPADFKPFSICSESSSLLKSTFSPIKTSPVLNLLVILCATGVPIVQYLHKTCTSDLEKFTCCRDLVILSNT